MFVLPTDANINWINDLVCSQDYELIKTPVQNHWMLTKEDFTVDFNVAQMSKSKSIMGFYGHKSTSYKYFKFNTPASNKIYSLPVNIKILDSAYTRSDNYWDKHRLDSLDKKDKGIIEMVKRIQGVPIFNTYNDIVKMIFTSYYVHGNFEWGPYFECYSFNEIEGQRFRLGIRSSNKWSTIIKPEAYVAYGTLDHKFKYGGGIRYNIDKNPQRQFGFYYENDLEQMGQSQYASTKIIFLLLY